MIKAVTDLRDGCVQLALLSLSLSRMLSLESLSITLQRHTASSRDYRLVKLAGSRSDSVGWCQYTKPTEDHQDYRDHHYDIGETQRPDPEDDIWVSRCRRLLRPSDATT